VRHRSRRSGRGERKIVEEKQSTYLVVTALGAARRGHIAQKGQETNQERETRRECLRSFKFLLPMRSDDSQKGGVS